MRDDPAPINPELDAAVEKTSGIKPAYAQEDTTPIYQIYKDSKIPVSKQLGPLWKSRIDQGVSARDDVELCWSEAIRYYNNDQMLHRNDGGTNGNSSGNRRYQRTVNDQWTETENVVFSNATTMLPMLYAKNPTVECTPTNTANTDYVDCCEKLINAILNMKTAPGVNLKSKARRGVLWSLLTNAAYIKIDFINKQDSSEQASKELADLSIQYANAKTKKEIKEIEGKLTALEEKVSFLSPSGPKVYIVSPFRLIIDPTSIEPDHSDANWMAEFCYLQTDYLNAIYGKDEDGKIVSVYEPTHVLNASKSVGDIQDEINNFTLFSKDKDEQAKNYGYNSDRAFKSACHTKCYWIWDKTTRRVFLYAENKWTWPLWVWDDPLRLLEFFPYSHLWFHETLEGSQPKGEVTYYLDQQDAINDINSEGARIRRWAKNNIFFDRNKITQDDAEKVLKGPDGTARGIDLPEGMKMSDVILSITPPSLNHPELLDPTNKFASINRITGISDAQKGAQFKTNTTNDAIDFYQKNVDIRVDEKIDAIEDWIGMIAWQILQTLAVNYTTEDVSAIIGPEHAKNWKQVTDLNEFRTTLNFRIVGGSTDKPTSKYKKDTALKMGQVLGQFANAIPAVGMVILKVFERAFVDDINLTEDDWKMLNQSMQDQANKAGGGPGEAGGAPPSEGEAAPPMDPEKVKELIASLPPEMQKKLQDLVHSGVAPSEALQQIVQEMHKQPPAAGQVPPANQTH